MISFDENKKEVMNNRPAASWTKEENPELIIENGEITGTENISLEGGTSIETC